jgi:hypothetical protein
MLFVEQSAFEARDQAAISALGQACLSAIVCQIFWAGDWNTNSSAD